MMKPLRIAVADDEPDVLEFYQIVLRELGHDVICAACNGRELVNECRELSPDLVIVDVKMPGVDGIEALQQLSEREPIPAIVVSGYHDPGTMQRAEEEYVLAYLIKPVKEADLQAAMSIAVRRNEEFAELRSQSRGVSEAMDRRRSILRATRVLMELGLEEEQALERLQQLARKHNCTLFEIAGSVAYGKRLPAEI